MEKTIATNNDIAVKGNQTKAKIKRIAFLSIKYFCLVLFSIIFIFPVIFLFSSSVMSDEQIRYTTSIFPTNFVLNFKPYQVVFENEFMKYLGNTLIVCVLNISGLCIMSSLTAFGLSKVKFAGQNAVFMIILSTLMLPATVTGVPLYTIYAKLGWEGTLYPLWVPIWFGGGALNIFLTRQFMKGIPHSYSEAAVLDGASSFQIYLQIVVPLIRPIIVYLAVTNFIGLWNDFQTPLMFVGNNTEKYTLSLMLYQKFGKRDSSYLPNVTMALGVIMMLPCIVLFGLFQKELVQGVGAIGIKG